MIDADKIVIIAYPTEPFVFSAIEGEKTVFTSTLNTYEELVAVIEGLKESFDTIEEIILHGQKQYLKKVKKLCKDSFDDKVSISII